MKRKRFSVTAIVALLVLAGCQGSEDTGLSPTAYEFDQDIYVVFHGQVFEDATELLPVERVGELAFELQEGMHENITHLSGAEVDHYYIWVCLGEACIPVDPFTYSS